MLKRVNKIFIGKDIASTGAIVDGASMTLVQSNIAEGEIVVLDSDYNAVVGGTATYPTTDKLYLAEGSSEIFNTVNPDGSALSGRTLLISNPLDGKLVNIYSGKDYVAKAEHTATLQPITDTIVAGTEYVLRIVYKDVYEDKGQFTDTYRYTAVAGDTSVDVFNGLRIRLNKDNGKYSVKRKGGSRLSVNAADVANLVLTAKPIPECTTSVNDIDEFTMVNFEVRLNYVDNDYYWTEVNLTAPVAYTQFSRGTGIWEVVRDTEKFAQSYEGVTNRIWFPIVKPEMRTIKSATYNMIVIEHDVDYRSPDNQYEKSTILTTEVAMPSGAAQQAVLLTNLNTWMASLPGAFANVVLT